MSIIPDQTTNEVFIDNTGDRCEDDSCQDGNCIGCRNGVRWCEDPRCHPNCPNCFIPDSSDTFFFFIIALVIVVIIAFAFILYAHFKDRPIM